MHKCEKSRLEVFWTHVQNLWLKLYGSKKVYLAAINVTSFIFFSRNVLNLYIKRRHIFPSQNRFDEKIMELEQLFWFSIRFFISFVFS